MTDVYTSTMSAQALGEQPADALFELPCACQNLRRLSRIVTRIYDQELRRADIEITQFGLLTDLVWLREQVLTAVRRGDERAAIHQRNLIPPGLLGGQPDVYQPYFILREHVIDRLYDQNIGYWQPDLQGLEHLGRADRAELLVDYLGLSEKQLVRTVERLAADGKYELAASLLESAGSRFEPSTPVANAKRLVYLKLMENIRTRTRSNSSFTRGRSASKHLRRPMASDES
jgi:hypothetical protein